MENYNPEFNNEGQMNQSFGPNAETTENGAMNGSGGITSVKEKAVNRANEMKDKIAERASSLSSQLSQKIDDNRTRASQGLRQTSQRLDSIAVYLDEHDSKDMGDALVRNTEQVIRKYPARSVLVGVLVGMMLGRIFR